jgi:hypothetical protein
MVKNELMYMNWREMIKSDKFASPAPKHMVNLYVNRWKEGSV